MSKKISIIIAVLIAVIGGSFFAWRSQNARANSEKIEAATLKELTATDVQKVLESEAKIDRLAVEAIVKTAETRKAFLSGINEYLAIAAQARREGFAENPDFKINVEYKRNMLLADLYRAKLSEGQTKSYIVAETDVKSVLDNAENQKQFGIETETMRKIQKAVAAGRGKESTIPPLEGARLAQAQQNWAKIKFLSERAKADADFMSQEYVRLRLKIVEAGILSNDYLQANYPKNIKPTNDDIKSYLSAHPEFDLNKKREKAESVLQRVKNGEDFAKLATEFSEDRQTKEKGGLYENVEKDFLWIEIEKTALSLDKNQVADKLIETNTGFHIVKLENKQTKKDRDGREITIFSVRHILFQYAFEEPEDNKIGVPPPFMKAEEIAHAQIEKEKRNRFVSAVVAQNPVKLPNDFEVNLPKTANGVNPPNESPKL
ncbi:MAG: peptidylprolyl isomerase [Pyrinomonadaceae bacterium]|nr:peptidylprolyl isomerase [Pyrinomonadaceae bacterium]